MSKSDSETAKRKRNQAIRWVVTIFLVTITITAIISFISEEIMAYSSMLVAFIILIVIVMIGITFDIIGVAVTSANERPFHSMAARKVPGSMEAIRLLRKADRVSSICNDVIGDVCGVVSGSASATIAMQVLQHFEADWEHFIPLMMSSLVAGLTVGGKALCKDFAIKSSTKIVTLTGKVIYLLRRLFCFGKR